MWKVALETPPPRSIFEQRGMLRVLEERLEREEFNGLSGALPLASATKFVDSVPYGHQ